MGTLKLVVRVLSSPPLDALGFDGSSGGDKASSSSSQGPANPSNHFDDTASEASRASEDQHTSLAVRGRGADRSAQKGDDSYVTSWWSDLTTSALSASTSSSSAAGGGGAAGAAAAKREAERIAMRRARLNPPRCVKMTICESRNEVLASIT